MAETFNHELGYRSVDEFNDYRTQFEATAERLRRGQPVHALLQGPKARIAMLYEHCLDAGLAELDFDAWQEGDEESLTMFIRGGLGAYYAETERDDGHGSADYFTLVPHIDGKVGGREIAIEATYLKKLYPVENK